jgi:hypothetical protein
MSDTEEKTIWAYLGLTRQEWYDNLPEGTKCAVKFCKEKCMNKNDYLCFKHRKGFTIWKNAFVIKIIQDNKLLKAKIAEANKILDEYTPKFNEYGHNYDTYDAKDIDNIIGFLRNALNTLPVSDKKVNA